MIGKPKAIDDALDILRDAHGGQALPPGEEGYIRRHIARYINTLDKLPSRPGTLLDVGCFPGHLSLLAAAKGWSVTGLSKMDGTHIGTSFEARMKAKGVRLFDVNVEREPFPFPDNQFDAVLFNETVEHLPYNPYHALDQIWRVLKPGGVLLFSVPNLASFDHRWALLKGRTIYPLLTKPLGESFHADISQRHIREYTADECRYLFGGQDKYLYSFAIQREIMDRSWDGLFYTEHGREVRLRNIRVGTVLREVCTRLFPGCRSNIVIVAEKRPSCVQLNESAISTEGFYPMEQSGTGDAFVRQPLNAAWSKQKAKITLKGVESDKRIERIDFLAWLPAPASVGSVRVSVCVNGMRLQELVVTPSPEPRRYSLIVPAGENPAHNKAALVLELETPGWCPDDHGISGDTRTLGIMIGLQQMMLFYAAEAPSF